MGRCQLRQALVGIAFMCAAPGVTRAQATTAEGTSVLVFPRVIADGTWETTIQIGNGANRPLYARCFYVNGALTNPALPAGPLNPPLWTLLEFSLALVRQQPTHWVASRGRLNDPLDLSCRTTDDCDGAGFDPGAVPATPSGFTGELRCIEADASGAPWSGNALYGVATLTHQASGELVKYAAVGLPGFETNNADTTLCLGGPSRAACSHGAEYAGCPLEWIVSHPSDADDRPVDGAARATDLTVVSCPENLETQSPSPLTLQFRVTNELEQTFSASTTITCWANLRLSDINAVFQRDTLGGNWAQTRVRAAVGNPRGFMLVQQTERATGQPPTFSATGTVPPHEAEPLGSDVMVLPPMAEVGQ
jgi:hypothetical protein